MNKREQFKVGQPKIKLTYRYTYRYIYIYTHTPIDKRNRTSWKGIADCTRGFVSRSITLPICQKLLEHEVIYSHVEYMCRGNYHIMGSRKWSAPAQIINGFKKASAGWPKSCGEASERASGREHARISLNFPRTRVTESVGWFTESTKMYRGGRPEYQRN